MTTSTSKYSGELRTHSVHTQSGETYITDAPTDNEGKGEAFSPTDIVATSLANCMMTIMGIVSKRKGLIIEGTEAKIDKFMGTDPRRITEIKIDFYFPLNFSEDERKLLEKSALNCPVAKSLSSDLKQNIEFHYPSF
ncbi:MAG: OsmC family protein [Gammaproteobacteria bacterium]|nr:osmotically inducible protein OsmC [Gammaproteobacteria bacterium]MCH1530669.1 OsmC family protein [Gammaproteobacteria bacterium]|tara:strand:- start:1363 stop:1773 length:411 start_codon:yes stop_codon:yes gene_type:complete